MLKRVCDRCEKEIVDFWVRMKCNKMTNNGYFYYNDRTYELCEACFSEFKKQFANKT